MTKPCETPCPKCGSPDVNRQFYARGEQVENPEYDERPCEWTVGQSYFYKADRDFIRNHCRCCQHDWVDKPLPNTKRVSTKATERP